MTVIKELNMKMESVNKKYLTRQMQIMTRNKINASEQWTIQTYS